MNPSIFDVVVADRSLPVRAKAERIAATLSSYGDRGAGTAVEALLSTEDQRVASFAGNYLALLPNVVDQKRQAARRLLTAKTELLIGLVRLVGALGDDQLETLVQRHLEDPSNETLKSVIFEIASDAPALVRKHADRVEYPHARKGMLAGAPAELAGALAARYLQRHDADILDDLGRFHTIEAAYALWELHPEVAQADEETWIACIENAGLSRDGQSKVVLGAPLRGYVVDSGEAPHVLGGQASGPTPICLTCETPAGLLVTLDPGALPYDLEHGIMPAFYWYDCACNGLSYAIVRFHAREQEVLLGPSGVPTRPSALIPGKRALLLERVRNDSGSSVDASGGSSLHQVGGPPRWRRVEPHPLCPVCRRSMPMLVTMDGGMSIFGRLGFSGILYGFWCRACRVSMTYRQGP